MAASAELTASHAGLTSRGDSFAPPSLSGSRMADAVRATALEVAREGGFGQSGTSLRMAETATVLWTRYLRYDAADPRWPDRDRFVLPAGRNPALLCALLHLTGVDGTGVEPTGFCPRLPPTPSGNAGNGQNIANEMAAGALGQGVGPAVGMALAERLLAARFGRSLVDHRTWVIATAGDLMDGASNEAIALAGYLRIDRLTCLYDEDAGESAACSTDQLRRFASYGWAVKQVDARDPVQIAGAMSFAIRSKKPTLIACRTERREQARPAYPDSPDNADPPVPVPEALADRWQAAGRRGAPARRSWLKRLARHARRPEFERVMAGRLPETWQEGLSAAKAELAGARPELASSEASKRVLEALAPALPELVGGSAMAAPGDRDFRSFGQVTPGAFGGRHLDFGFREHGMASAFAGLALHGGLIPFGVSKLASSDLVRPALRLHASSGHRVIHLLTHDAAGSEGGPALWPVEHLASLRAMPGVLVFRPADAIETAECWELAMRRSDGPSLIILADRTVPVLRSEVAENRCARGGYVLAEADGARQATLIATGPEVSAAMDARALLGADGIAVAVVSLPCWELFEAQDRAMRAHVLGGVPRIGIEAANGFGWDRWLGEDGLFIGTGGWGTSAYTPGLDRPFDITAAGVAAAVRRRLGNDTYMTSEGPRE